MQIEPCIEERIDYLAAAIGTLIGRIERTLGGRPARTGAKLIQWDRRENDGQEELAAWLKGVTSGKRTSDDDSVGEGRRCDNEGAI